MGFVGRELPRPVTAWHTSGPEGGSGDPNWSVLPGYGAPTASSWANAAGRSDSLWPVSFIASGSV